MSAENRAPALPPSVVERCAATDGRYGGCHGASASGLRLPAVVVDEDDAPVDQITQSLAELAESMQARRLRWEAGQVTGR